MSKKIRAMEKIKLAFKVVDDAKLRLAAAVWEGILPGDRVYWQHGDYRRTGIVISADSSRVCVKCSASKHGRQFVGTERITAIERPEPAQRPNLQEKP